MIEGLDWASKYRRVVHFDSDDVDYHSESTEAFTTFQLDVKDYNNVEESLKAFLLPDEFNGKNQYNAEGIGRINAKTRLSILSTLYRMV